LLDLRSQLNPQQLEAVEAAEGPILILAGAGSGKTRVITFRILHLIENLGVRPESVLAVTFTNKAADQMKSRVRARLGTGRSADPWISTFHSLCVRLLRREIEPLGYSRDFTIYDSDDQLQVVKAILKEMAVDDRSLTPRSVQSRISAAKNQRTSPERMAEDAWQPDWERTAAVYAEYEKRLRKANALDFDDLLGKTVELFEKHPAVAESYSSRFRYIMVDEYQDTNRTQYKLIRSLSGTHGNVCVVGDEDQSIYSWRGADIQNILSFEKDYPDVRTVRLEQNYRSTKTILAAAGAVVANNEHRKGKELWTENDAGGKIEYFEARDPDQEAAFVAEKVMSHRRVHPNQPIAVLYRINFLSRVLEEMFRRFDIPYRVVGGFSFYERAEVKDLLAYLTAALNPDDSVHLLRIINTPPRGIGKSTLDSLMDRAAQREIPLWQAIGSVVGEDTLPLRTRRALEGFRDLMDQFIEAAWSLDASGLLQRVVEKTGYAEILREEATEESLARVDNIRELMNAAQESEERGESLREFLDSAALVSDQDEFDEAAPVTFMTLHTAKGLEFPVVFIIGLEDGLFPHSRSLNEQASLEEERRLFYVGMTRAEAQLYLTASRFRRTFGTMEPAVSEISRFLREIPSHLVAGLAGLNEGLNEGPAGGLRGSGARERVAWSGRSYNTPGEVRGALDGGASSGLAPRASGRRGGKPGWSQGTRVKHPKYGFGTVLRAEGTGSEAKLTISFPNFGLKKLVARYASLEVV
jgi:DNA helicase-2/ATP-dependent DNA helicase PcrA